MPFVLSMVPQVFGLNIDANLEPKKEALLRLGLTQKQVGNVLARFPQLLAIAEKNIEATAAHLVSLVRPDALLCCCGVLYS